MELIDEQEKLLDPLKYYKTELTEKFLNKLTDTFKKLLKESNIDIEVNRKSVEEYNEISSTKAKNENILKWLKRFSYLVIISSICLTIYEINNITILKKLFDMNKNIYNITIKTVITGFFIIALSILNFKYINKKKYIYIQKIEELGTELKAKQDECYLQVAPLLKLFESNMANKFITEIIPTLILDKYFKIERYADLVYNFGMAEQLDSNLSAKDLISGEILGNPFVIIKSIQNRVVDETYHGSLTVSWTEYYTYNGERKSRNRTQTLRASIVKPKQIFEEIIDLIYGNDAAEHLSFIREPNFIHDFTPKELAKYLKKIEKEIKKKSEKSIKTGDSFLEMGNLEFDGLFGALNRNNEVEFRVLFTPIAQRNMIELLKDKDFGDDFVFHKMNKLNKISNGKNWILNVNKSYYNDFSFDVIKEKYYEINKKFFSNFYRLFLPIFTIPVYHQHKSQNYIYGNEFNYNYNSYIAEVMANSLGQNLFSHSESITPSILKTNTIKTQEDIDLVEVKGKSYKTITRTQYIPVTANNGRTYNVPVDWIEYIPLSTLGRMEIKKINIEEKDFEKSINHEFSKSIGNKKYTYKNNIFAIFTNENEIRHSKILKNLTNK